MLTWGIVAPSPRLGLGKRLHQIHTELSALMDQWSPDQVAVEEPFVARNPRSALAVGQAQGIALCVAAGRGIEAIRYPPSQVKLAVTGYGGGTKDQVQRMVAIQLGLEEHDISEDASDALAVALCHVRASNLSEILAKDRLE